GTGSGVAPPRESTPANRGPCRGNPALRGFAGYVAALSALCPPPVRRYGEVPPTALGSSQGAIPTVTAPRRRPLLQRKLTSLTAYTDELDAILPPTLTGYNAGSTVRRAVERLVQIVVEAAADAGGLLLAEEARL